MSERGYWKRDQVLRKDHGMVNLHLDLSARRTLSPYV
jgi:hypothetical protein